MKKIGKPFTKGHIPWNKNIPYTEKIKRKISEVLKKRYKNKEDHPRYGKKHSEETKNKISKSKEGYSAPNSTKEKMRKSMIEWHKNNLPSRGMLNKKHSEETKRKIGLVHKGKILSNTTIEKMKRARAKMVFPLKDTSIEIKIQDFLTKLHIEYFTHKYMPIENAYQCDILIPKQKGISQKIIIECDGCYWHGCPISKE